MRIHLRTTPSTSIVPFNYQGLLCGTLHKWLGINEHHDKLSLYSFSWLNNAEKRKDGFVFPNGSSWFISCHYEHMLKKLIEGIQNDPEMFNGLVVKEVTLQQNPSFGNEQVFRVANPVFIKRNVGERQHFYYFNDAESNQLLTENLQFKLKAAGLAFENASVTFITQNTGFVPKVKGFTYKGIFNKGSVCPVKVTGTPEQLAFAWNVGVGNSTGIGFGALV